MDSWYESPAPPFYCCHTPTWSWHDDQMYCESCVADIPTPSGPPQDAHVRVFRGEPLLPPPVTVEAPPGPPRHPEECPACDEPVSESSWDAEYGVCSACAEAHEEEDDASADEYGRSLEEDHFGFEGDDFDRE